MIKRRFFKLDHGDRDGSDPSSSSSDSELEAEAEATEEESEDDATAEAKPNHDEAGSTSSGWFIYLTVCFFVSLCKMCLVVLALTRYVELH